MIVPYLILSLVFLVGLCWGSFLNVLAYRLIHEPSIVYPLRSFCPLCRHSLFAMDLVPFFAWFIRQGACRFCKGSISFLYPLIELITGIVAVLLYLCINDIVYLVFASFFCSALIIITRSDLETTLISQWTTIFLVPVALAATLLFKLPISFFESALGALSAYAFLYFLALGYRKYKKIEGIGEGDVDMLSMIGAFLGPIGWWLTLVIASFIGTFVALYIIITSSHKIENIKIPFGPFLALGSFITLLCKPWLLSIFMPFW